MGALILHFSFPLLHPFHTHSAASLFLALRLGEACEFHESCRHLDSHAICNQEELKCRCQENFHPRISDNGTPECIQGERWITFSTFLPLFLFAFSLASSSLSRQKLANWITRLSMNLCHSACTRPLCTLCPLYAFSSNGKVK